MRTILITRDQHEESGGCGQAPLKFGHFFVYHDNGEVEEIGPATTLYFTPDKVYVLLDQWPTATYDRDDVYLITREEAPALPLN